MLFEGRLLHKLTPICLKTTDFFVLPTVKKGYCNAAAKAMSCELPIISNNLSFNWGVLNETHSIMIDSQDMEQIKDLIIKLRDALRSVKSWQTEL